MADQKIERKLVRKLVATVVLLSSTHRFHFLDDPCKLPPTLGIKSGRPSAIAWDVRPERTACDSHRAASNASSGPRRHCHRSRRPWPAPARALAEPAGSPGSRNTLRKDGLPAHTNPDAQAAHPPPALKSNFPALGLPTVLGSTPDDAPTPALFPASGANFQPANFNSA